MSKRIGDGMAYRSDGGVNLTCNLKTLIDEDTKEELTRLATREGMNLSQYLRELIMIHVYGRKHLIRLTKARLERMVGAGSDEDE